MPWIRCHPFSGIGPALDCPLAVSVRLIAIHHSLACKGTHEDDASAMNAINLRSTKLLKVTRKSMFIAPLFFGICGMVFLVDGLKQEVRLNFGTYLGAAFIVFALALLITNMRAYGGDEPPNR